MDNKFLFKNQYVCEFIAGFNNTSHFTGFDLGESFALRHAFCEGDKTCFKLGSALLLRDTR